MMEGRVKCWFGDKGYGFIRSSAGDDVFVHFRDLRGTDHLAKGAAVVFDMSPGREEGKLRAVNVRLAGAAPSRDPSPHSPHVLTEDSLRDELAAAAQINRRSPVMDAIIGVAVSHSWIIPVS